MKHILFISYYFEPFPTVGAKRVSYWAKYIHQHGIKADVVTAFEGEEDGYTRYFVPPLYNTEPWNIFSKDPGVKWKNALIRFFNEKGDLPDYDVILISGGPFMHMGISKYLKRRFGAKIILDFRDPFINPRFKESFLKRYIKKNINRKFIHDADRVITVNKFCATLLEAEKSKIEIIENGFDEKETALVEKKPFNNDLINIINTGKIYINLSNFFEVLKQTFHDKIIFHQFGIESNEERMLSLFEHEPFFISHGHVDYLTALQNIACADICTLFIIGETFESTTKIFDYIAFNQKILIIMEETPRTGSLNEITKDYPNVVWARNNTNDIEQALNKIVDMKPREFDSSKFSRKVSLEKLVSVIDKLSD